MDCSVQGFSVHEILQARILQWVAFSFSRGSSRPGDWTWISCTAGRFFTDWVTNTTILNFKNLAMKKNAKCSNPHVGSKTVFFKRCSRRGCHEGSSRVQWEELAGRQAWVRTAACSHLAHYSGSLSFFCSKARWWICIFSFGLVIKWVYELLNTL